MHSGAGNAEVATQDENRKQVINEVLDPFSKYNLLYTRSWKHFRFTIPLFQRTQTRQ